MEEKETAKQDKISAELVAHVPDVVILATQELKDLPAVQRLEGVLMMLDISGFTAMCEEFAKRNLGVDILTKTLNDYLGHIQDTVLRAGGDVIEFAGDALLVLWAIEGNDSEPRKGAIAKAVKCSREIQKKCHNWDTQVDVLLGVKIALAVGSLAITYVGGKVSHHFSTSGETVNEVNQAEKYCEKGTIVLAYSAWRLCPEKKGVQAVRLDDKHVKIIAVKKTWASEYLEQSKIVEPRKAKALTQQAALRNIELKTVDKNKLRPFIAAPVLHKLDGNQPLEYLSEHRDVTILFINLVLESAHDHAACLQKVQEVIGAAVLQFQGLTNKIFEFDKGTSFIVLFGMPGFKHEEEVVHALHCSGQIRRNINSLPEVKAVSIGVTTGKVFCGVVGHPERHEYTVIGPKVNMAARLMMYYPKVVSCDSETRLRSKLDPCHFEELPEITLKGLDDPGQIYEYNTSAVSRDNSIPDAKSPLLGYNKEFTAGILAVQGASTAETGEKHSQFIVIQGEPGMGKTRFLRAIMDGANKYHMRVVSARPSVCDASTPYHTVCILLSELLELSGIESAQSKEAELNERYQGTALMHQLCLVNNLLGIQLTGSDAIERMTPAQRNLQLHKLIGKIVSDTELDHHEGTLIAIDDAEYIDADSWDYLKDFVGDSCIISLSLGPFRKDESTPKAATEILQDQSTIHMKLNGLDPQCMEPLLCQQMEVATVPRELTNMLSSNLKGRLNPSWVKQCIANMLHHKQLEIDTHRVQPACIIAHGIRLMELKVPPSLRDCMIAFIDRLSETEGMAVKMASIIGTSFTDDVLVTLMSHMSSDKVHQSIGALLSASVFFYDNGQLRFRSSTLQETAYSLLLDKQRCKLHEQYAMYLEKKYLGVTSKTKSFFRKTCNRVPTVRMADTSERQLQLVYPQLVTHWRKAGNKAKTINYLIHAAESAIALGNTMQAISFIFQAKKASPSPAQTEHLNALGARAASSLFVLRKKRVDMSVMKMRWRAAAVKAREYYQAGKITSMPSDFRMKSDERTKMKEYRSQLSLDEEPKQPCLPLLDRIVSCIPSWIYFSIVYLLFLYCYFLYAY
ncbi:adenylate cyclase type 10-like [Amphiura filiformis]|uniref:adenylate cyclase type 10-like n=1 Tax=Amphiura filiformis TaxID=82378 RepID=UPI003B2189FB